MDTSYNDQGVSDLFYCLQSGFPKWQNARPVSMACSIPPMQWQSEIIFFITARSWSGPPARTGKLIPADPATDHENKDNVLSWQ